MVFISDVIQKVEDMQKHRTVPSAEVLKFLSNINLDHILPSKPPITFRRFMVLSCLSYLNTSAHLYPSGQTLLWRGSHL